MSARQIKTAILSTALVIVVLFIGFGCTCTKVTSGWGTQVCIPKCVEQIKYSGNSIKIGGITFPLGADKVVINSVEWDTKKLQEAAPAIQAMEQMRLQFQADMVIKIQTSDYNTFKAWDDQRTEIQNKLFQLAYLVTLNQPAAVNKWIDAYTTTIPASTKSGGTWSTNLPHASHATEILVPKENVKAQPIGSFLQ